ISTGAERFEAEFKRDNQGLEIQRSLPGGIQSRWSRDKLGRPIRHEIGQEKQLYSSKTYVWGLNNRLLKLIDGLNRETVFQHDAVGNLLSARYSDGSFDLRMPDAVGNLFKTPSQKDREYGPAGQLLAVHSSKGTTRYSYDVEGNLISKLEPGEKLWRYEWNSNGMLAKVIRPDGQEVCFDYDPLGRRIRKTFNNKITRWVWDGNNPLHEWVEHLPENLSATQILSRQQLAEDIRATQRQQLLQAIEPQGPPAFEEGNIDNPVTWLFEPDSFTPMAKLVGDEHYSIIADHLGTPSVIFDKNGQQVWASEMDVWGNLRQLRGERNFCPFRFPGQYEDGETGLYYNRFRYYDPQAGQYVSQDPIRLSGGSKLYAYVHDPVTWTDPLGLKGGCEKYGDIPQEHHARYDRYLARNPEKVLAPNDWYKRAQQAWANNAGGNEFERAVREFMGAPLGRGSKPVSIDGYVPDLPVGKEFGVTDIKNVENLCNSPQLTAFSDYAVDNNLPFSIVISPRTETVSDPLLENIRKSGGELMEFDEVTQEFSFIDISKKGPWKR